MRRFGKVDVGGSLLFVNFTTRVPSVLGWYNDGLTCSESIPRKGLILAGFFYPSIGNLVVVLVGVFSIVLPFTC